MSLADKLASKLTSKSNQGTYGLMVRDSHWYAMGALVGFISNKAIKNHILIALSIAILSLCLANNSYATSSSITITINDNVVDLNVAPTANGAFSKSSASKIGVATTNYTGYTLSISASGNNNGSSSSNGNGSNNPTALINGDKSLSSIETAITEEQFKALDSTAYNNMWGYLPSKYNSETNTSFLPSPSTNGDILDTTSVANASGEINEYEITLGARVDTTASLGSYSNVFLVDVVANAIPYTIIFDDNVVGSMPTDINDETTGATITLPNNVPVRDGYTFLGWCSVAPTTTTANNTKTDTCPSPATTYPASGTITLGQTGGNNDYHLYAMWQELTMQTFTNKMCSTYATNQDYTLKDIRDGKTYTVRYINGNCWMTQNLAIEPGTHMTANDTNITSAQYNNTGYYSLPGEGYDLKENGSATNDNCYGETNGTGDVYRGAGWTNACMHLPDITNVSNSELTAKQLGAWYNYAATTAGYISGASAVTAEATQSICPKEWVLPSESQASEIVGHISDFSPVHGGYYYNGTLNNASSYGYWWTSTLTSDYTPNRHYLLYISNSLETRTFYRTGGFFVRCVRTT